MNTCKKCSLPFEITAKDMAFYKKMDVPAPTWCPNCRQLRRMIWRNERHLFRRKCSKTGVDMISMFPENTPFPVYTDKVWNSDTWEVPQMDYDPARPFLEQWRELQLKTPRAAMFRVEDTLINSDFTNTILSAKDCYMVFGAGNTENCFYSLFVDRSKDTCDGLVVMDCELCYEISDCTNCYNVRYAEESKNCRDSAFLKDCIGCKNCFGCTNLRNKEYYIWNKQVTPEEYKTLMSKINFGSFEQMQYYLKVWNKFKVENCINKAMHGQNNEGSSGDYLNDTKNTEASFDCSDLEDCKFCTSVRYQTKDAYDYDYWGYTSELIYECLGGGTNCYNMKFCATIIENCKNIEYSDLCRGCENCFGCVGLKNAKYRILNKQYTPDDYFRLVEEIKDAMKKDGSYGEFFPLAYSPHPFNHSTAFDFHDLTKEQAEAFGMRWEEVERLKGVSSYVIPDTIGEIPATITSELLCCETCQKKYRVTGPETSLYLKQSIPLPRKCFDCRHMTRVRSRNPRKFWERSCMNNCGRTFQTTFLPERPDKVFCETCFHQAIN